MKLTDIVFIHKQSLPVMETRNLVLQAGGSQLVICGRKVQSDTIRDKEVSSTEAQNLLGNIHISKNRYRTVFETDQIAKSDSIKKVH